MRNIEEQTAYSLIKFFSCREHLESFKNGSVLFRTPHYYRLCEEIGRGDQAESCLGYWSRDSGHEFPEIYTEHGQALNLGSIKSLLVYPLKEQSDSWLQSWSIIGKYNKFENSIEKMLKDFGPYFVLLPAQNINKYVSAITKITGLKVEHGAIKYSNDIMEKSLSVKGQTFEYQKEYRFLLGECDKSCKDDLAVNISNMSTLLSNAKSLKFENPKGDILYCSTGEKRVCRVKQMLPY
ncbi:hypothetical protein CBQ28_09595 [Pseudoalteromonas sp. GCY]|uniref:hypothetical protein n=1 Tax=Pseudoalteromonas sp. GCY TaxID=2003316 RepID=UPI000BFEEFAC|nr:hypothetical protein [Pseudoalteromonas sp. GCY]PHI37257.1 hypothetical protein CBQ28_09595 [Pseudoalteromonas sp. GCY]QQQ67175.1 hypothetical protein JJQ94_23585 [Pseudoalteromonas sp. GCY]